MSEDMELDTSTLLWKPLYKLEEAEWVVLGIPYGSRELGEPDQIHAPNKIREFFSNYFWSYDLERGKDLGDKKIVDLGNIPSSENFEEMSNKVSETIKEIKDKNENAKILFLGGQHSITSATVKALKPKSILSLDAHPDLCDKYEDFEHSKACTMRRIHELGTELHLRGTRTASKEEHDFMKENNIDWNKNLEFESSVDYLSIDLDVLDPIYVGLGAPESLGAKPEDIINIIRKTDFKYCDIVEWIPDKGFPVVVQILKEILFKL